MVRIRGLQQNMGGKANYCQPYSCFYDLLAGGHAANVHPWSLAKHCFCEMCSLAVKFVPTKLRTGVTVEQFSIRMSCIF